MSYYPLVLNHRHVRRIIDRHATVLILARRLPLGPREIHDSLAVKRNRQHVRAARLELQEDPRAFTIKVEAVTPMRLDELAFALIRQAGFRTTDEFLEDWHSRRKEVDEAFVHWFGFVEDARFLHERVHRGYTSNPALSARGEPEAVSDADLDRMAKRAASRRDSQDEAFQERAKRSIGIRMNQAARRGDQNAIQRASTELAAILGSAGTACVFG